MKQIFIITLLLTAFTSLAQDTLFLKSGEIEIVELISVNKKAELLYYKSGTKTSVRTFESLKAYTNYAGADETNWPLFEGQTESYMQEHYAVQSSSYDPSKYTYGKFSVGVNLLSCLTAYSDKFDFSLASNYNQGFYLQYDFSSKFGLRLPARIGFSRAKGTYPASSLFISYYHAKDLVFEVGLEPIFMMDNNRKISPYLMPGLYTGLVGGVIANTDPITYNLISYSVMGPSNYFRTAMNAGVQFNFAKRLQLNLEFGINYNTSRIYYYYNYNNSTVIFKNTNPRIGMQAAVNLVYRFGGKLRE